MRHPSGLPRPGPQGRARRVARRPPGAQRHVRRRVGHGPEARDPEAPVLGVLRGGPRRAHIHGRGAGVDGRRKRPCQHCVAPAALQPGRDLGRAPSQRPEAEYGGSQPGAEPRREQASRELQWRASDAHPLVGSADPGQGLRRLQVRAHQRRGLVAGARASAQDWQRRGRTSQSGASRVACAACLCGPFAVSSPDVPQGRAAAAGSQALHALQSHGGGRAGAVQVLQVAVLDQQEAVRAAGALPKAPARIPRECRWVH